MKLLFIILFFAFGFLLRADSPRDLEVAREALRDGLWEVARTHAAKVAGEEPRVVMAESLAREGKFSELLSLFEHWGAQEEPIFAYYRALALAKIGRLREAMGVLGTRNFQGTDCELPSRRLMLQLQGDEASLKKLWTEIAAATNSTVRELAVAYVGLGEMEAMKQLLPKCPTAELRRFVGLNLGVRELREKGATFDSGVKRIKSIVKDNPGAAGAMEAFAVLADALEREGRYQEAAAVCTEALEIWPQATRLFVFHEVQAWAQRKLGNGEAALSEFGLASNLTTNREELASVLLAEGDILAELGRGEESMARYRAVLGEYAETESGKRLVGVIRARERESEARELYRKYRFEQAQTIFAEIARTDPARAARMEFYQVLCLYGRGMDDEAGRRAAILARDAPDPGLRAMVTLWLAKFDFNRRSYDESSKRFAEFADLRATAAEAPGALLWSARAAFAGNDFPGTVTLVSRLTERYPEAKERIAGALLQGEALVELARFDEAALVLERVILADSATDDERVQAQLLKGDALFAMGADNPQRYREALEEYRTLRQGGSLPPAKRIVLAAKIGRTLEKLHRMDDAIDHYYTEVVLAYRDGRRQGIVYDDDAKAAFSRAAFRLADEYESRGREFQAVHILELVVASDVPAAAEAARRIDRMQMKGSFL